MPTIPNAQHEAALLVQLSQVAATLGLTEAINWAMSDDFDTDYATFSQKHSRGGKASFYLATICDFFHSVGTLVKYDMLDADITLEYFEVTAIWERIHDWIEGQDGGDACGQVWTNFKYLVDRAEMLRAEAVLSD